METAPSEADLKWLLHADDACVGGKKKKQKSKKGKKTKKHYKKKGKKGQKGKRSSKSSGLVLQLVRKGRKKTKRHHNFGHGGFRSWDSGSGSE